MSRRERHLRIIENMGEQRAIAAVKDMLRSNDKFSMFADDAIAKLAAKLVHGWKFELKLLSM